MHNFKELNCWQEAKDFSVFTYQVTSKFPSSEVYGITSQIKRAVVSIPSNIAEGAGRNSNKEFKHFLSIANGSAYELQTQLILTIELNLVSKESIQPILNLIIEIQKMNYSFQKSIANKNSILNTQT